jgi:hypothetical protein
MAALVILCGIIAIVIGVWYNINYGKFKPKIEIFSDGTGRMLFLGVSKRCKKQMVRFNAEYQVGQIINYQGQKYVIEEIKPITTIDVKYLGPRHGLAAYLKRA